MKFLLIPIFLTMFASLAIAEEIRLYTDYRPVKILYVAEGASPELEANKAGLEGNWKKIARQDIPSDKSDRDIWIYSGGQIKADPVKKQDKENRKKIKSDAVTKLKGLGLTDDELSVLRLG